MTGKFSRREILAATGAGIAGLAMAGAALPAPARSRKMREALDKVLGGSPVEQGGVDLKTPIIAENGGDVPISVSVDSPMTAENYVRAIHLFAEENPTPITSSFYFTPFSGRAWVRLNIRLANTQRVTAIAEMSDGSFRAATKDVKVTIGGCGGG